MNKGISLLLLIFSILICGIDTDKVCANENDKPPSYEEFFPEIGYKTAEEAIKEFEQHFKQDLKLPLRIPPIAFTHYFGRFNNLDGDTNDSLDLAFINEKSPENHYKIDIRYLKNKITIRDKGNQKIYTLKNGQKAIFIIERNSNILVFEKDHWQYMLGIDKRIANKVTPEILVEIANSIDY
ncbi:hypothetical protein [Bacillus benzoevorans]|uniref:DUF4367 domain-containing protein n=1 Tax=Bacillus benzoevorans TaxID=1456 RepID=A0A7X0HUU6_9BACI|nr:hypothetical protein [Bacillus benzoevorans]MBB6447243.1 hypothetical protein [Bacillus benzoevorans]